MNGDVGEGGNDLLLGREVGALLELKVTDGTAQSEVAVDTAKVDEATSSTDASLFALILRLMVEGERLCAALDAEYRSRVSRVSLSCVLARLCKSMVPNFYIYHVDSVFGDDADRSSAARDFLLVLWVYASTKSVHEPFPLSMTSNTHHLE